MTSEPQYEVAWHGAAWRDIPQPAELVHYRKPQVERVPMGTYKTILLGILTDSWADVRAIKYHAEQRGMETRRVLDYLTRLVDEGRIEHQTIRRLQGGLMRSQRLYRRRQAAAVAA